MGVGVVAVEREPDFDRSAAQVDRLGATAGAVEELSRFEQRVGQPSPLDDPGALGRRILGIALAIIGILAAIFVLLVLFVLRMRRVPRTPPPQSQAPTIVRLIDPSEALRASLGDAQRARTRASILALRGELFAREGVPRGATTRDAFERIPSASHGVRLAITHLERAAFGPDDRLDTAIDEALGAVESLLRSGG